MSSQLPASSVLLIGTKSKLGQKLLPSLTVRRQRHRLGLSQEDFVEKVDMHRTYVSSIELGKVQVGIRVAFRLAKALGVPLSRLVQEVEREL